jgi:phthiocerol/phenolphthiocerol synthesis type-I polyketide synthase E
MTIDADAGTLADLFADREPGAELPAPFTAQKKRRIRDFYDGINRSLSGSIYADDAIFLNWGYIADGSPRSARIELPADWPNRHRDLADRDILDVGCGRGGTISTIERFFAPGEIWGLDLSPGAVAFCQRRVAGPAVHFVNGESERLPFLDRFFDVVTNVESSCLYPDVYAFYREVYRVLAPGGRFLYTDLMPAAHLDDYRASLRGLGFAFVRDQDVTPNVLLSLDSDAARRSQVHTRENPREVMEFFLAMPGSKPYNDLREGRLSYRIWELAKPE